MNSALEENENAGTVDGPGARLRAMREAQEMDLQRAANLLHLSDEKLAALESDEYQDLGGSVFVQGYLRKYARLLETPVEPLLRAYQGSRRDHGHPPELKVTQLPDEVRSSHTLIRLMTWVIVLGLVALVVVWWRGYLEWPLPQQSLGLGQAPEATQEAQPGLEQQIPVQEELERIPPLLEIDDRGEAALMLPPKSTPSAVPESPPTEVPAPEVPAPEMPDSVEPTPDTGPLELAPAPLSPESTPLAAADVVAAAGPKVIIDYAGTSWTRIRDSSGTFGITGEVPAGSRRELGGTPPYDVVLGNARSISITIDGRPFDLQPHTRGDVARFTLDPER